MASLWSAGYVVIENALQSKPWFTGAFFIIMGLILALFGIRSLRMSFAVIGAILAGLVGSVLGYGLYQNIGAMIGGMMLCLFVGSLLYKTYVVGVFLVGALFGFTLTWLLTSALNYNAPLVLLALISLGTGIVALTLEDKVLIIATAVSGALLTVSGAANLIWAPTGQFAWQTLVQLNQELRLGVFSNHVIWALTGWGLITIAGIILQMLLVQGRKSQY